MAYLVLYRHFNPYIGLIHLFNKRKIGLNHVGKNNAQIFMACTALLYRSVLLKPYSG